MKNPDPAMHRDIDAAHKRAIDLRAASYHAKLARENAAWRDRALTLTLLAILAVAVWLLSLEVAKP